MLTLLTEPELKILKKLLAMSDRQAVRYIGKHYDWTINQDNRMFYKDNDSPVLVVAHLDTFFNKKQRVQTVELANDILLFSPHCDDRVGVFVCLEMLKDFDVDVLITTGEESCMSTAFEFKQIVPHDYNWLVEFDRAGSDVVMYEYDDCDELRYDLEAVGFEIGVGSYSDICELESLERGAFNVGVGYHFQHTEKCFVSLQTLEDQFYRFLEFLDLNFENQYVHNPVRTGFIYRGRVGSYRHLNRYFISDLGGGHHDHSYDLYFDEAEEIEYLVDEDPDDFEVEIEEGGFDDFHDEIANLDGWATYNH